MHVTIATTPVTRTIAATFEPLNPFDDVDDAAEADADDEIDDWEDVPVVVMFAIGPPGNEMSGGDARVVVETDDEERNLEGKSEPRTGPCAPRCESTVLLPVAVGDVVGVDDDPERVKKTPEVEPPEIWQSKHMTVPGML